MKSVGVLGAGSFGVTVAKLLALQNSVLIYSRNEEQVASINDKHEINGIKLSKNISASLDLSTIANDCTVIFPVVPSHGFRSVIRKISPYLNPRHVIIHGTKGFDLNGLRYNQISTLTREQVFTMSEVIKSETPVVRVGCLSGANIASEILAGEPAATVIASDFDEVVKIGQSLLKNPKFQVYGSSDLVGAELGGALKNTTALAAGILKGAGFGSNLWGLLLTQGLAEMIKLGKAMGATTKAFLGVAGVADLAATASSTKSRNFTFGSQFAKGKSIPDILSQMPEPAEGLRTVSIAYHLAKYYSITLPIIDILYRAFYHELDIESAINELLEYPYSIDL